MIYKQKAYKTFHVGIEHEDAHAVKADHQSCRLGKWYYEGTGHAALDLLSRDWQMNKELLQQILDNYRSMEDASDRGMDRIDAMITEKHS
jgi:hypothetical protein